MAVTNFLVSSLPAYVQENRDLIIANLALPNDTRKYFSLVTGVKSSMHLNYLNANVTLQDGSVCGFDPLDELELTASTLTVAPIKVQGEICPQTLLGKWGEYLVRLNAREIKRDLPFEGYIVEAITREIRKKLNSLIWNGSTNDGDPFDGIFSLIKSNPLPEGNILTINCCTDNCTTDVSIVPSYNILGGLQVAYVAIDDDTANRGVDFFLSSEFYRAFIMQLAQANLYHYAGPVDEYPETIILPGSNARVINAPGMPNQSIVATFRGNFVYGTDMEGDDEVFDIWWSNDNRVFRYEVLFTAGVSAYFWDKVYDISIECGG